MGIKTATASRVPVCNKTEATVLRYLLPLLLAAPATASTLTCDSTTGYVFPRTTTYTATASTRGPETVPPLAPLGSALYAAFYIQGPAYNCTPENCTIISAQVTDNRGTVYATPVFHQSYPGMGSTPIWVSPTSVPALSTPTVFTCTVSVQITPTDGSTLTGPAASSSIKTSCNPVVDGLTRTGGVVTAGRATPVLSTIDYQSPDQHDFGDVPPNSTGNRLVLPAPSSGSLAAEILWYGPSGTSMTRKIGSAGPFNVPPGSTYELDTAGKGLQLDLKASDTASPGEITGNLTLTLTCP